MFEESATFDYTVYSYKVDKYGERRGGKERVSCHVTDVVFLHELNALSSRLACNEEGPLNGLMFVSRDGFWWYDEKRYLAGGFYMDDSTKVFDREPKEVRSTEDRLYTVRHQPDGAWCWDETFDRPWTSQGLCFRNGVLVSGWAANEATATADGDYIEFKRTE